MAEAEVGPPVRKAKRLPWMPPPSSKFDDMLAGIVLRKPGDGYDLRPGEKPWEFERRMTKENNNFKSQYPPFNIEPFKDSRERLLGEDGKGMTPEQRERRARWLRDQQLAPHEPVYVPMPRNFFRRVYGKPMTAIYTAKTSIRNALMFWTPPKSLPPPAERKIIPFGLLFWGIAVAVYYKAKYHSNSWENHGVGTNFLHVLSPDYTNVTKSKEPQEYANTDFGKRKVLMDIKTSGPEWA
ncbi:uncharacterized protein LOC132552171 [Ylistrum balloti]|uniref:uncharacterized protein LOC132552171 n=1 Tax=Ylistrum balloti TaxID=509963 RepID=UPI002905F461|nr:uncharacterized protein LOC132552171 [Ylistrum balloti]